MIVPLRRQQQPAGEVPVTCPGCGHVTVIQFWMELTDEHTEDGASIVRISWTQDEHHCPEPDDRPGLAAAA